MAKVKKCPNCGNRSLRFLVGKWICVECEYHKDKPRRMKRTFR